MSYQTREEVRTLECAWYEPVAGHLTDADIDSLSVEAKLALLANDELWEKYCEAP